jgi:hypothetical protein
VGVDCLEQLQNLVELPALTVQVSPGDVSSVAPQLVEQEIVKVCEHHYEDLCPGCPDCVETYLTAAPPSKVVCAEVALLEECPRFG